MAFTQRFVKVDILSSERGESGEIRVKIGDDASGDGYSADAAMWGTDGFYSRPLDADADGACMGMFLTDGVDGRILGTKDNRVVKNYGELEPGDRAIVGYGPLRYVMKHADDSHNFTSESPDGQLVLMQLAGDKFTLMMPGDLGTSMVQVKSGKILLMVDGGGSIVIDKTGVHIGGNVAELNTGMVTLGMIAPSAPLLVGVNSALVGPVGATGSPSTKVLVAI